MLITGPRNFQKQVGPPILGSILKWEESWAGVGVGMEVGDQLNLTGLSVREVLVPDPG